MSETETKKETRAAAPRREELTSMIYSFDEETGELTEVVNDGRFVLDIDGEEVTGTHIHANGEDHRVTGVFLATTPPSIALLSEDRTETRFGVLLDAGSTRDGQYVGGSIDRDSQLLTQQEEGTWVGTKI